MKQANTDRWKIQIQEIAARIRELRGDMRTVPRTEMAKKTGVSLGDVQRHMKPAQMDFPFTFIHKCALAVRRWR